MTRPTQYTIAGALAEHPPFEGKWTTAYYNQAKDTTLIGWRYGSVLLMSLFNKSTGMHIRTHLFTGDHMPPSTIGFEQLLERLCTE